MNDLIVKQEKAGQKDLINSELLPIGEKSGAWEKLEKMGVKRGKLVDDLFLEAELPEGWFKRPTCHPMWSDLVDDKGNKIADIFYKAALYDRDAFIAVD